MPYKTLVEVLVTVATLPVTSVVVLQAGVEVCVKVLVTVGMLSTLEQKGVATLCWRMMLMMSVTALQLRLRFSRGVANATAAKATARKDLAMVVDEANV